VVVTTNDLEFLRLWPQLDGEENASQDLIGLSKTDFSNTSIICPRNWL